MERNNDRNPKVIYSIMSGRPVYNLSPVEVHWCTH